MKYLPLLLILFPITTWSAESKVCSAETDQKSFITNWREGNNQVQVLSTISGTEFVIDHGRIVFDGHLNGGENNDFIFEATTGAGSSGDRVYSILLQCHGYLKLIGSDYFAKVEVMDESEGNDSGFKDIKIYSYKRDAQGGISYKGKEALMTPHIWRFNPETKKYEGKSE
ncbi:hypothetical protein [Pseudomonas brassicacearum]|uniref:Uncharacterized protein n=1 Tax=Pseudomonas brassicacearum TaxID=930166 RepID=A0A423GXP4_9PSED|nr:hypothetical protein [Pseudomonas brassicacearum]RON02637.1 hypothetical protein BK658_07020 [Pseudomonas brassicacearum]